MEPVHPFLIISFFNLLSACSEINSHFNQKEISQNRILHHARKPLDGDDCLVVFINRISMLHQNSYGFSIAFTYSTYEISPFSYSIALNFEICAE